MTVGNMLVIMISVYHVRYALIPLFATLYYTWGRVDIRTYDSGYFVNWTLIAFYDNSLYFTPTVTLSRLSLLGNRACNITIHVVHLVSPLRRN